MIGSKLVELAPPFPPPSLSSSSLCDASHLIGFRGLGSFSLPPTGDDLGFLPFDPLLLDPFDLNLDLAPLPPSFGSCLYYHQLHLEEHQPTSQLPTSE